MLCLKCLSFGRVWQWVIVALASGLPQILAAAPSIFAFTPESGASGVSVRIQGSGFLGVTEVRFNQTTALFTVESVFSILATVPVGATSGRLFVQTTAGSATSSGIFKLPPKITRFDPNAGGGGDSVVVRGENFEGATEVTFGGVPSAFTVVAGSQINATVPPGAVTGPLAVRTVAGTGISVEIFVVGNAPWIGSIEPNRAAVGAAVVIRGANLSAVYEVWFNQTRAAFAPVAATQINTIVPAGASTGKLVLVTPSGTATSSIPFQVDDGRPFIDSFDPTSGGAGAKIIIRGANFTTTRAVNFAGTNASFTVEASTQMSALVPANAVPGFIAISNAVGSVTSSLPFKVLGLAPVLSGFSPGAAQPGDSVVLRGSGFQSATGLWFNQVPSPFAVVADTQINAVVPAGASTGFIVVSNAFGAVTSTIPFTVLGPAPVVARFSPQSGPAGTRVIIDGENFEEVRGVRFGGAEAFFSINAPTQIEAMVPSAAITGPVTVESFSGTNVSSGYFSLPPFLTDFSPTSGVSGAYVLLNGGNLLTTTEVRLNQVPASFLVLSNSAVRIEVPRMGVSGPFSVLTPAGIVATAGWFQVQPQITLSISRIDATTNAITWPATGFAWGLQECGSTFLDWKAYGGTPLLTNGLFVVRVPSEVQPRYYRLVLQ